MNKFYFSLIVILLFTTEAFSQSIKYNWARQLPWDRDIPFSPLNSDNRGGLYIATNFSDTFSFKGKEYIPLGGRDMVLAKYNTAGEIQWVKTGSTKDARSCQASYVDKDGNIYVAGEFTDTATFDTITITKGISILNGVYLVKYDSTGKLLWARNTGEGYSSSAVRVACDHSGNVHLLADWNYWVEFEGVRYSGITTASAGCFVAKYDGDGNFLWYKAGALISFDDIGFTAKNDIILFGTSIISSYNYWDNNIIYGLGNSASDILTIKLDSTGKFLWKKMEGGDNDVVGNFLQVFDDGSYMVNGCVRGKALIAGTNVTANASYCENFIAKYDSAAKGRWIKKASMSQTSWPTSLKTFRKDSSFVLSFLNFMGPATCIYDGVPYYSDYRNFYIGESDSTMNYSKFVRQVDDNYNYLDPFILLSDDSGMYMLTYLTGGKAFNATDTIGTFNVVKRTMVLARFEWDNSVSIKENLSDAEFTIFPDPASEMMYVHTPFFSSTPLRCLIYDTQGKLIRSLNLTTNSSQGIEIDVSILPENLYLLQINSAHTRFTKKFVVN